MKLGKDGAGRQAFLAFPKIRIRNTALYYIVAWSKVLLNTQSIAYQIMYGHKYLILLVLLLTSMPHLPRITDHQPLPARPYGGSWFGRMQANNLATPQAIKHALSLPLGQHYCTSPYSVCGRTGALKDMGTPHAPSHLNMIQGSQALPKPAGPDYPNRGVQILAHASFGLEPCALVALGFARLTLSSGDHELC